MQSLYKIGFWNYTACGVRDEKDVALWKELGFNLAMSFVYDPNTCEKESMLRTLDACEKEGLRVILYDKRTDYHTLLAKGEAAFLAGVEKAVRDFGSHKAVFGFFTGDEPAAESKEELDAAAYALKAVKAAAPHLTPYCNLFPYCEGLKVSADEYCENWYRALHTASPEIVSYDYYGQCCYFDTEFYRDLYFTNLRAYKRLAERMGAEAWTCLLSVGHGSLRVPTQDDIRWQLNTAAAHGFTGFMWFYLYENNFDPWWGYRGSPINVWLGGKKTALYDALSYENNVFLRHFAPILAKYRFVKAMHFNACYGGFEPFRPYGGIRSLEIWVNEGCPLIVSEFENEAGRAFVVVNNSQTQPARIRLHFEDWTGRGEETPWLIPGGMQIFEIPKEREG